MFLILASKFLLLLLFLVRGMRAGFPCNTSTIMTSHNLCLTRTSAFTQPPVILLYGEVPFSWATVVGKLLCNICHLWDIAQEKSYPQHQDVVLSHICAVGQQIHWWNFLCSGFLNPENKSLFSFWFTSVS